MMNTHRTYSSKHPPTANALALMMNTHRTYSSKHPPTALALMMNTHRTYSFKHPPDVAFLSRMRQICTHTCRSTSIESISRVYGAQAVVISVDPTRVYVTDPKDTPNHTLETTVLGPQGQKYCW